MKKIVKAMRKVIYLRDQSNFKRYINSLLEEVDFTPIVNEIPQKIKSITFVIPGMPAFSGGHTSILRLGTELSKRGYEVGYVSFAPQSIDDMKKNAEINLANYKGKILGDDITKVKSDVVFATSWESVYYSRKMSGYKMYFIQDYEPYFNLYGESYIMAQKSYEVGYHMVSLGKWTKHMIEKECNINSRLDYITFPYEGKEYFAKERNFDEYKTKKEFNFAVYIKDVGKRAPYLIQYLLTKLKKDFSEEGITLNIKYYGEDKNFKCEGGENIGKLSKSELLNLYNTSDFGLVASLTNISLVPYEMLATGLPVIEFKEGTFEYFFPEDTAIITSFDYNDFYNQVKEAINNTDKLKEMNKNSMKFLKELSCEKTTDEFIEILDMIGSGKGE